jgi:hypothetical protein
MDARACKVHGLGLRRADGRPKRAQRMGRTTQPSFLFCCGFKCVAAVLGAFQGPPEEREARGGVKWQGRGVRAMYEDASGGRGTLRRSQLSARGVWTMGSVVADSALGVQARPCVHSRALHAYVLERQATVGLAWCCSGPRIVAVSRLAYTLALCCTHTPVHRTSLPPLFYSPAPAVPPQRQRSAGQRRRTHFHPRHFAGSSVSRGAAGANAGLFSLRLQVGGPRLPPWPHVTALLSRPQPRAVVAAWPSSAPCCRSTPAPAQLFLGGGASRWRPGS